MEFANVVCGNIAAKASQSGKVVNINPPVALHPPVSGLLIPSGKTALCFPIHIGEGDKMEMVLFLPK
jgi:CheY-specific phosphatase CheX